MLYFLNNIIKFKISNYNNQIIFKILKKLKIINDYKIFNIIRIANTLNYFDLFNNIIFEIFNKSLSNKKIIF